MQVREATIDDVGAIVALLADDELGRRRENPAKIAPCIAAFDSIRHDPNQLLVVLDDGGDVVGTLHLSLIPNSASRAGGEPRSRQCESPPPDEAKDWGAS